MANYACIDIGTLRPEDCLDAISIVEAVAKPNNSGGSSKHEDTTALPSPYRQSMRHQLECRHDFNDIPEVLNEKSIKHPHVELFVQFRQLEEASLAHLETELNSFEAALKSNAKGGIHPKLIMERLGNLLDRYATAIRNIEYMRGLQDIECSTAPIIRGKVLGMYSSGRDRFKTFKDGPAAVADPLRRFLTNKLSMSWVKSQFASIGTSPASRIDPIHASTGMSSATIGRPKEISKPIDRLARFIVAMVGGLSLIAPMLTMTFHKSQTKSLLTVSISVVLFAGLAATICNGSNLEILAATAAYTAVLIAFVSQCP